MKTILIVSVVMLFSVGTLSAGEIIITNPNNQSKWLIGSKQEITWKVQGDTPNLTITLWRGNIKMGVIADGIVVPPTRAITYTMTHSWKVGDLLGGKALPGNNYQIGIQAQGSRYCYKSAPYFEMREMVIKQFPKAKFWDLYLNGVHVYSPSSGQSTWFKNQSEKNIIYVTVSDIPSGLENNCRIRVQARINMKTPPMSQITKADVSKWGTPRYFKVKVQIENQPSGLYGGSKEFSIATPQFTWKDVQTWSYNSGREFFRNVPELFWNPDETYIAPYLGTKNFRVAVCIDEKNQISEPDESNNSNPQWPYIVFRTEGKGPWLQLLKHNPPVSSQVIGSTMQIRWKVRGIGKMKILLWQDNDLIGVIADNIQPPPPGPNIVEMSYNWKVGYLQGRRKAVEPGKKYWIMIKPMSLASFQQTTVKYSFEMLALKKPIIIPD